MSILQVSCLYDRLGVSYNHSSVKADTEGAEAVKTSMFGINPYARYYACTADKFSFYLQGGFHYTSGKTEDADAFNNWGINIKPGIAYNLSDKFAINATFGNLGYNDFNGDASSFGLDINMSTLLFGVTYKF